MNRRIRFMIGFLSLFIALLACNLPSNQSQSDQGSDDSPSADINMDQALTLAVQTIQAATQQAAAGIPTDTPVPPATAPTVSVSADTNCRTGPNINYDFVTLFKAGMTAKVVGKYSSANYWIIEIPNGGGSTCWLWGQYATILGDTSGLPEGSPPPLPPTPTPAPSAPNPPKGLNASCVFTNLSQMSGQIWILKFQWDVTLNWKDNSDNENGFHIYKDGSQIATLGEGATSYSDTTIYLFDLNAHTITYGVQAFNNYGESVIKDIEVTTCP